MIFWTECISRSSTRISIGRPANQIPLINYTRLKEKRVEIIVLQLIRNLHSIQHHENTTAQIMLSKNNTSNNPSGPTVREIIPPASKLQKAVEKLMQGCITGHYKYNPNKQQRQRKPLEIDKTKPRWTNNSNVIAQAMHGWWILTNIS